MTLAQNCAPLPLPRAAKQALALHTAGVVRAVLRGQLSPDAVDEMTRRYARHLGGACYPCHWCGRCPCRCNRLGAVKGSR